MTVLASGFARLEAPRVDGLGNIFFSDIEGGVYQATPAGEVATVVPRRKMVGGILLHAEGGIVISGRDICHVQDGQSRILFRLEPPPLFWNDMFADDQGRVLVSAIRGDVRLPGDVEPGELWRVDAGGQGTQLYDIPFGNGIAASPDGNWLYHADTGARVVLVHRLTPEGAAVEGRVLARTPEGLPDGVAVDVDGCIWVAVHGAGVILRLTPAGAVERVLEVPAREVTSLCFGGPDLLDMFITTADNVEEPERRGTLFRTRAPVAGLPVAPVRL
jgi:gluconolactonase